MNADTLLRALGKELRRSESADEELLEAYCRGELSSAQVRDLEQRSGSDPELAARLELSRPLAEDEKARVLDSLPARPIESRFRNRSTIAVGMTLAAAAAVAFLIKGSADSVEPPPRYSFEVLRAQRIERAADAASVSGRVRVARELLPIFVLRPETKYAHPMDGAVFLRSASGTEVQTKWAAWPHRVERDAGGGMRIELIAGRALPRTGTLLLCAFESEKGAPSVANLADGAACAAHSSVEYEVTAARGE